MRQRLLVTKNERERREAARQLREQRKNAANVQKNVLLQRQEERRHLNTAVKKHRKGMKAQLEELLG